MVSWEKQTDHREEQCPHKGSRVNRKEASYSPDLVKVTLFGKRVFGRWNQSKKSKMLKLRLGYLGRFYSKTRERQSKT